MLKLYNYRISKNELYLKRIYFFIAPFLVIVCIFFILVIKKTASSVKGYGLRLN